MPGTSSALTTMRALTLARCLAQCCSPIGPETCSPQVTVQSDDDGPKLVARFLLPPDYPASCPFVELEAMPREALERDLETLEAQARIFWEDAGGDVILFPFVEFLREQLAQLCPAEREPWHQARGRSFAATAHRVRWLGSPCFVATGGVASCSAAHLSPRSLQQEGAPREPADDLAAEETGTSEREARWEELCPEEEVRWELARALAEMVRRDSMRSTSSL